MGRIKDIKLRKLLDSRGNPTVEAEISTGKSIGITAAPSGASTGKHEVVAFPEGGVDRAVSKFNKGIRKKLIGFDTSDQKGFDSLLHEIDGTPDFSSIGGNISIALSLSLAKAEASERGIPLFRHLLKKSKYTLPLPFGNVLGGGKHAVGGTDIQEYMAVSFGKRFSDSAFGNVAVHSKLGKMLKEKAGTLGKGDEGGWVTAISNRDAMDCVAKSCALATKDMGFKIRPALDVAASSFYENGKYVYRDGALAPEEQIDFIAGLVDEFGIYAVEDPLEEDAWDDWAALTRRIGGKCLVIGDDIFVTNSKRFKKGIAMGAANAVLVKPNQIGTFTETVEVIELAHKNGYKTVVSHRSGETTDATIAHIAVAFGCHGIKTGTIGGERIAKLNELIRIEELIR